MYWAILIAQKCMKDDIRKRVAFSYALSQDRKQYNSFRVIRLLHELLLRYRLPALVAEAQL